MAVKYPESVRFKAEDLYVLGGLNFEEVAQATRAIVKEICGEDKAVSVSQLKRWSEEDRQGSEGKGWPEKREERRQRRKRIEDEKEALLEELIAEARRTKDPQKIYAFVRLDKKPGAAARRPEETPAPDIDRPALFLEDMQFIAKILKEVDPEGLKVFARNFDLIINRFKAQHAQAS